MKAFVQQTAAKHASTQGGLLPCLHEIQAELGFIPNDYLDSVATAFSLSTAEVHGVVSFYHDFRTSPSAQHCIQICCAEACQASGSRELEAGAADVFRRCNPRLCHSESRSYLTIKKGLKPFFLMIFIPISSYNFHVSCIWSLTIHCF